MTHVPHSPLALLDVRGLDVRFRGRDGGHHAVKQLDFTLGQGETLALVGESGCGKSTTALALLRLLAPEARIAGEVRFRGQDLVRLPLPQLRAIRGGEISMIFQEPMTSLNPVHTVGAQIVESLRLHQGLSREAAHRRAVEMLALVKIPEPQRRIEDYPHNLSGGQRQRVMIAMAVACQPRLLIADEPTTALDVSVQARILELLDELRRELSMGLLLITHDLGVVSQWADRVLVMLDGEKIEEASAVELLARPRHAYTQGLLGASLHGGKALHYSSARLPRSGARMAARLDGRRRIPSGPHARARPHAAVGAVPAHDVPPARRGPAARGGRRIVRYRARRDAGAGGRVRLRQVHAVAHAAQADRPGVRPHRAGRRGSGVPAAAPGAAMAPAHPDGVPGSVCLAQSPAQRVRHAGRGAGAAWRTRPPRPARAHRRHAGPGRAAGLGRRPLSARVLRRTAPAHRHRPRADPASGPGGAGRAGVGAGRIHPGADPEPAGGPEAGLRPVVPVHLARPVGGALSVGSRHRHAPGQDRGGRAAGRDLARAAPSLYPGADRRRAQAGLAAGRAGTAAAQRARHEKYPHAPRTTCACCRGGAFHLGAARQ